MPMRIAASHLRQAEARLEDAKEAVLKPNYPYALRLSQECVELCLKAILKVAGIEYPKVHDVSDILVEVKERFPNWLQTEMNFLSESSRVLTKKRELSTHGAEEAFLSPNEVISKADAEDAVQRAEKTFGLCKKVLNELESSKANRTHSGVNAV